MYDQWEYFWRCLEANMRWVSPGLVSLRYIWCHWKPDGMIVILWKARFTQIHLKWYIFTGDPQFQTPIQTNDNKGRSIIKACYKGTPTTKASYYWTHFTMPSLHGTPCMCTNIIELVLISYGSIWKYDIAVTYFVHS